MHPESRGQSSAEMQLCARFAIIFNRAGRAGVSVSEPAGSTEREL